MFSDSSNYIPSIHTKSVKFLGRIIDCSISDRKSVDELEGKLEDGLKLIDQSSFTGTCKLWILHRLLIPRVKWPLMIYEVPMSRAIKLEQRVSTYIRKWLRLHRSTTDLCVYSRHSPCPLPISSVTSLLKSSNSSAYLQLRDSSDPLVSSHWKPTEPMTKLIIAKAKDKHKSISPSLAAGNWDVRKSVEVAEHSVKLNKIIGHTQNTKAGLGKTAHKPVPPIHSHEYWKLISDTLLGHEEDTNLSKAVQLHVQGQWTKWTDYISNDLTWHTLLSMPKSLLSFCLNSTFDTLPSPANLSRWNIDANNTCFLCKNSPCTSAHILGACRISLNQGRYTFRHDSVLKVIFNYISAFLSSKGPSKPKRIHEVKFVKPGERFTKKNSKYEGLLLLSNDWISLVDLDNNYVFPPHIALTAMRPDIVIYSNTIKRIIILELTCPCEENMSKWHSEKFQKYLALIEQIKYGGWVVDFFAVEVGARGYCSTSLLTAVHKLGFSPKLQHSLIKESSKTSLTCSFCIWLTRDGVSWDADIISATKQSLTTSHNTLSSDLNFASMGKKPNAQSFPKKKSLTSSKKTELQPFIHSGFINAGNTCYLNSLFQTFSILPPFWSYTPEEHGHISPIFKSFVLNLSLCRRNTSPVDLSLFLKVFGEQLRHRDPPIDINAQQDVPGILEILLEELVNSSNLSQSQLTTCLHYEYVCSCDNSSSSGESMMVLPVPVVDHISKCIDKLLLTQTLSDENRWFCNVCNTKQDSTLFVEVKKSLIY